MSGQQNKKKIGEQVATLHLQNIRKQSVQIPDTDGRIVHLQFQRFAGCPICNVQLRPYTRRISEITTAGGREVVVFHSSVEAMLPYQGELPFDAVADPEKILYRQFGVESSPLAKAHPKVWAAIAQGIFTIKPTNLVEGGGNGLTADFLIAPNGTILAAKYGTHAADNWSVDELLTLLRQHRTVPTTSAFAVTETAAL